MKRITLILAALFLSFSLFAKEDKKGRTIDYEDINHMLHTLKTKARSPFIRLEKKVEINNDTLTLSDVTFTMLHADDTTEIMQIDEEGNIALPILEAEQADKTQIHISHKDEDVGFFIRIDVNTIDTKTINYKDLFVLLDDFNQIAPELSPLPGWMIPDMEMMGFDFSDKAQITIHAQDGKKVFETDNKNRIEIEYSKQWMQENPMVEFSVIPDFMYPES